MDPVNSTRDPPVKTSFSKKIIIKKKENVDAESAVSKQVLGCGLDLCLLRPCLLQCTFQVFFVLIITYFGVMRLLFMYCSLNTNVDFLIVNSAFMHCLRTHKFYFLTIFLLKMGLMVLFIHLKIILLQYFQFSILAK